MSIDYAYNIAVTRGIQSYLRVQYLSPDPYVVKTLSTIKPN